jgi:hypothetical protein
VFCSSVIGICKFCGREGDLQYSHIIPEFFYQYDEKHRFLHVTMADRYPKFGQKGTREYLLCRDCEQYFNDKFEKPMKRMWIDRPALPSVLHGDGIVIRDLEYAPFKLFHLSVLWRAGVASEAATTVQLGPHEAKIHSMLQDLDPGPATRYPIIARVLYLPKTRELADGVVSMPHAGRNGGQTVYVSVFGGCAWHYVVSSHRVDATIQEWALNEAGRMFALVDELRDVQELGAVFRNYQQNAERFGWKDPWAPRKTDG